MLILEGTEKKQELRTQSPSNQREKSCWLFQALDLVLIDSPSLIPEHELRANCVWLFWTSSLYFCAESIVSTSELDFFTIIRLFRVLAFTFAFMLNVVLVSLFGL